MRADAQPVKNCGCRELRPDGGRVLTPPWRGDILLLNYNREIKRAGSIRAPGPAITTKNKHLLAIYSIPTRGFTAVVSVFRGTPPTKPLFAKNRFFNPGAASDHSWAHRVGGQPKLACFKFAIAPGDII